MVLDTIKFKDTRMEDLKGIVDFSNKKFVHFFDFSETDDADLVMAAVEWKTYFSDMRFSVFCSIHHPKLKLPPVKVINKRHIYIHSDVKHGRKRVTEIKKTRFSTRATATEER